jgi:NTP pyrophosphatase (non-canonical NTP hydrolase)
MDRQEFIEKLPYANPHLTIKELDDTIYDSWEASDKNHPERKPGHYNLDICEEECAELIVEISKTKRETGNRYDLLQELADVIICARTVQEINGFTDEEVIRAVDVKRMRIEDNIKKEGYHQ